MARVARVVVPGCMHHVTQRGNHRQAVFFGDADRRVYLSTLWDSAARHGLEVIGHCLMSNHVHLLVVPQKEDSLAKTLARVSNAYARWQHVRQQQTGHLWQDRYYSCALDQAAAWEALRYVELNPVRAGLVRRAWEWEWSSARAHSC
ncbi:MAG: transposase [Acidobacteria bacterium]|nr:transposase [Acidobacteriota bacterium]